MNQAFGLKANAGLQQNEDGLNPGRRLACWGAVVWSLGLQFGSRRWHGQEVRHRIYENAY
jgi:hypothetical protein